MTPAIHNAQDDLSDALSYIPNPDQRRLVRHAINRLERAYRDEIMRQQDLALRAAIRDTLPAPAPKGPDLVPVLQRSLSALETLGPDAFKKKGKTGT